MQVINLTQHTPTPAQAAEVAFVTLPDDVRAQVLALITFAPAEVNYETLRERADTLAQIAANSGANVAMLGGAPFFQSFLENALLAQGVGFCYALSERVARDEVQADGSVRKVSVFEHAGFYFSPEWGESALTLVERLLFITPGA